MTATQQEKGIYTSRRCFETAQGHPTQVGQSICTKIPYRGYEVAIVTRSRHDGGDFLDADIRIHDAKGVDVTDWLMPEFNGVVVATAGSLKEAMNAIDDMAEDNDIAQDD
jgi:hypothetical protein